MNEDNGTINLNALIFQTKLLLETSNNIIADNLLRRNLKIFIVLARSIIIEMGGGSVELSKTDLSKLYKKEFDEELEYWFDDIPNMTIDK